MSITCKNCGNVFEGNYCNNCGQPAETHPVNASFIAHDVQHGLFHFESGLLYSAKELFLRPGHTIREYLHGKRVKHYKPISMVILVATLHGVLYHFLHLNVFKGVESEVFNYEELNEWVSHHFAIITLATLPVFALSSFLVFKKQGYNYTEHIILNSFYSTQRLWVRIIMMPLLLLPDAPETVNVLMKVFMLVDVLLMFWTYTQFFEKLSKMKTILLTLLCFVVFYMLFTILFAIGYLMYHNFL